MANQAFFHSLSPNYEYRIIHELQKNGSGRIVTRNAEILPRVDLSLLKSVRNLIIISGIAYCVISSVFLFRNQLQNPQKQNAVFTGIPIDSTKDTGITEVIRLAKAFENTLKENQLSLLQLEYSKKDAVRWSNFPQAFSRPNRVGLSLGSLDPAQLSAAKALMASVLAQGSVNEGDDELQGILAADDYIAKTTGQANAFGAGNYYIAFLGKPGTTALWELQFGGHHFAFANTYNEGKITGVTPSFRGVEPMAPVTAAGRNYQPMEQEREAFSKIIEALSKAAKDSAKLSGTFSDVLLGPGNDGKFPGIKQGVRIGGLNSAQQKQIVKSIGFYVNDLDAATAKAVMAKYTAELAGTYFSYSGSGTMNQANDYVRLDGPNIWIEYSVQPSRDFPNTTHPHSVWRDRTSDYGGN